jgi:hypothetical protein
MKWNIVPESRLHRRRFLEKTALAAAAGELALHRQLGLAASLHDGHALAPKPGHFPPKAKHVILFFFTGGLSHVDTFDYKPQLQKDHGKTVEGASRAAQRIAMEFQAVRPMRQDGQRFISPTWVRSPMSFVFCIRSEEIRRDTRQPRSEC